MKRSYILFLVLAAANYSYSQSCGSLTIDSITDPGPFTVASIVEADGMRDGPDYDGATLYYPTNGSPPYPSIVIVPGYFAYQSSVAAWGPFYASHGIVAMTIGTNSIFDYPDLRAAGLLDGIETIKQENTRALSPIFGDVDLSKFAVSGWSMGGGGSQRAAVMEPSIKAVVALCPWLSEGSLTQSDLDHSVPVLIFSGELDPTAPPIEHSDVHYNYTPTTTHKLLYEVTNGNHSVANTPTGGQNEVGKVALSWLNYYLREDSCYCPFLLDTPETASNYLTTVECPELTTGIQDWDLANAGIAKLFPNPANQSINLELKNIHPGANYEIVSLTGSSLASGKLKNKLEKIDINDLAPGLYILRVKTSEEVQSIRFSVQ